MIEEIVEICHTSEQYDGAGLTPFQRHIDDYIAGKRTVPVSRTTRDGGDSNIYFTFSDKLMKYFAKDENHIKKSYEAALKYGFRGHSKGGKNGIFYVRKKDSRIKKMMPKLITKNGDAIQNDLEIGKEGLSKLKYVKIVCHNPSGERVVGVYNENNGRILFLDMARY